MLTPISARVSRGRSAKSNSRADSERIRFCQVPGVLKFTGTERRCGCRALGEGWDSGGWEEEAVLEAGGADGCTTACVPEKCRPEDARNATWDPRILYDNREKTRNLFGNRARRATTV